MNAAIYLRADRPGAAGEPELRRQLRELARHARQRGCTVTAVYRDCGGGGDWDRPGLRALLSNAAAHPLVLVTGFDRLACGMAPLYHLTERLERAGLRAVSPAGPLPSAAAQRGVYRALCGAIRRTGCLWRP